ncbi:class I SAM-dependent methyltransferase [Roseovarius sp. EL26]|uniref:class I SAM-dependent methyltransferase n=1 Tax=Roseovarius sp. EL26 TaxID=2126672 RepID=UPI000EA02491|nr:class I SAM-dependent methyltransferase [Roseovarius sp. EL26]
MDNGWEASAEAWVNSMGKHGDFSRWAVLDSPMLERVRLAAPLRVLDVGCGEGRFCRKMAETIPEVFGIDPTVRLLELARGKGGAEYVEGVAEALPFKDGHFDLVVSYLSLIDISDVSTALREMIRVLRPGGRVLITNLTGWVTASQEHGGWSRDERGATTMTIDRYLEEHAHWGEWDGIRIQNWHRPLSFYMQHFLELGLTLTHFDEPRANAVDDQRYDACPYLMLMEWRK